MTEPTADDTGSGPAHPRDVAPPAQGGAAETPPGQPGQWGGPLPPGGAFLPGQPGPPVAPGASQLPHCYRHPDRETYVSCQRCSRPICPDCMRPAAVGFHCPEETGGGSRGPDRGGSGARGSFGGRPGRTRQGLVTQILIALCVIGYFLQGLPGLGRNAADLNSFSRHYLLSGLDVALDSEYYRLVTAAFLHSHYLHILINLYALFVLGYQLEGIIGRARLVGLFLAGAVGGNVLSYAMNGLEAYSLGASTAIFAFFGAFYVIARRMRANTTQILILIVLNFVITFSLSNIDHWGHIGGLVAGLIVGAIYAYVPPRRAAVQAAGVLALVGVCFAVALAKTSSLGLPIFGAY